MVLDRAQVEDLTHSLAAVEPELEQAKATETETAQALTEAESAVAEWQKQFEQHHLQSTDANRAADRARAEIEVLDQGILQASRRIEALENESGTIDTAKIAAELTGMENTSAELAAEEQGEQKALDELKTELAGLQGELGESEDRYREVQRDLHTREGRLESLQALQQAALEDREGERWLQAQGLADAPRLARVIRVDSGWETAVEVALGHWLQSVLVADGSALRGSLAELEKASLDFVENTATGFKARRGSLAEKVTAPDAVLEWLDAVSTAETLEQAWSGRNDLGVGESLITPNGEWVGRGWLRIARGQSEHDSMLARERMIESLGTDVARLTEEAEALSGSISRVREAAETCGVRIQDVQARVTALHRRRNEVDGKLESRRSNLSMLEDRQTRIREESTQLRRQLGKDEKSVSESRGRLEILVANMSGMTEQRQDLESRRTSLMEERDVARKRAAEARDDRHELALKTESRRASLESLRQSLQRMDNQFGQLQQRFLTLSEQLARSESPEKSHEAEMEQLLGRRLETEARLGEARARLQSLENDYREKDAERQKAIQAADEIRQDLERARLQQQELELNARAIQRQVEELGGDVEALAGSVPDDVRPDAWEEELERLQIRITRLEPVNLAAIQEFEEEQKRKDYLDEQNDDLCSALATLENAIAKIDRKTRTRFKETFERVNKGVQELFPRLFGGGHAYLELTGEDLLTTGVSIMAQPPGKRVSSLHLLSGGEKALTAVSFVFSIFRLNPAPFCLLDEVDAPLDDANVLRFANMVKEMSDSVQFIVVTHNKITMELAYQMSGVTMREPGVSRLVQVDIDEAARLAAS
jgi:chromosome segregation protein